MRDVTHNTTAELIDQLDGQDSETVARAAKELSSRDEVGVVARLLRLLRKTDDAVIRDAVALALSDKGEPQAYDVLVDLLRDERTVHSRGTLLYALGSYDCSSIFPLLIELVIKGNFEAARQALSLIHGIEIELSDEEWSSYTGRIKRALKMASRERRPLITELLSLFDQSVA